MKKKWLAVTLSVCLMVVIAGGIWMVQPVLTQTLRQTVTASIDEHINGSVSYSALQWSYSGSIVLRDPVVSDRQGNAVLSGDFVDISIDWLQAAYALADGTNPVQAISTIIINKPVANVQQNDDKKWNVTDLIKTSDTSSDPGFRGSVRVQDGFIHAVLSDGTAIDAQNVDGNVNWSSYPAVQCDVSVMIDGKPVSLSGKYTSQYQYDAVVRADSVKAAYAVPFVPESLSLTIADGTADQIRFRVWQDRDGFHMSGNADVRGGKATVAGYAVTDVKGHVDLNEEEVSLRDVSGIVNGQNISVRGNIKLNTGATMFQLWAEAPGIDLSALVKDRDIPVSGFVGIQACLWGTLDDISASGTISLPDVTAQGVEVQRGQADFKYENKMISIANFTANVADGHINGQADYNIETGYFQGAVQFSDIDLSRIPQIPVSILGIVSGKGDFKGTSLTDLEVNGTVTGQRLSYNGIEADRADGTFSYHNGIVSLPQFNASVRGGMVSASGFYGGAQTDVSVTVSQIPMDIFSAYISVPLNGRLSAAAHIHGSMPEWDAVIEAVDGSVQGMPFDRINGTLRSKDSRIDIPSLTWLYKDGKHQGSGYVDMRSRALQLSVDTDHMRLERLIPAMTQGTLPLTGWVYNHVTISGTLDHPVASGSLRLNNGSAYGYLYKSVQAGYRYENGTVQIDNGDIEAYSSHIRIYGSLGSMLALHVESPDIDIARLFPKNKVSRNGSLALSAYVGGTMDNPTATGTIQAEQLSFNHVPIQHLYGEFGYYDGIARLSELRFSQNNGSYQAYGTWNTKNGWIMARSSVISADMASWITLLGLPLQHISGKIDGDIAIDGTMNNPRGTVRGKITQASMAGYAVTPSSIDVELEGGVVKVNDLSVEVDGGLLKAVGTYSLHGPVNLQAGCRNFSSVILLDVAGIKNIPVDTHIDGAVIVSGTGDHPNADISVQFNGGTINGIDFTNVYGMFNLRDRILHINQAFISKDPYKASAYGTIPISVLTGDSTDEAMNVTVKLDHAGLDIFTFLTPLVTEGTGNLSGEVLLTGTAVQPLLKGDITVQDGMVKFRDLFNPLEHINGNIHFAGNEIALTSVGEMNARRKLGKTTPKGSYTAAAKLKLDGLQIVHYDGSLVLDKLAVDCPYYKGPLSGQFSIDQGTGLPMLSGIVNVNNATVNIPFLMDMSGSGNDMELNLTVSLGDKVRLYNPLLYDLAVRGSANFQGTLHHPQPSGHFEAAHGSIRYLDTRFQISKGEADFSQIDSFLPYLHVEAHGRVSTYNIGLTLTGPADHMNLHLASQPPLSRQQILSLITLRNSGKNTSSISGEDVSNLVGTGLRMTLNSLGITNELEHFLHLDMLNVTTGALGYNEKITSENRNYYNVEMGKYLFNDFMITAAFGVNHDDNNVGFRYDLGSRFGINAWHEDKGDNFAGGMYRYSF